MYFRKYLGVTLIELLICLTLSLVILTSLLSLYVTAKKNFYWQLSLASIQENAQVAMQVLTTDINAAGFIGCARLTATFPIHNHTTVEFNVNTKISGAAASVSVRHLDTSASVLELPMQDFMSLTVIGAHVYVPDDTLLISDCRSADIFRIQSVRTLDKDRQLLISNEPLSKNYSANADIGRLEINKYYVKQKRNDSKVGKSIYGLFKKNINGHAIEIAENITALRLNYLTQAIAMHLTVGDEVISKDWYAYASY